MAKSSVEIRVPNLIKDLPIDHYDQDVRLESIYIYFGL